MSIYDDSIALARELIAEFKNPKVLTFEEVTKASDGAGGYTHSWSTKFTSYGPVLPLSGAEKVTAMQLQDESTHKTFIEFSSGTPTTNDRLLFNGEYYSITGVLDIAKANAVYKISLKSGVVT